MKAISSSCMRAEVFTNQQDFGAVAQDLQTTQDAPNNVPARRLQLPHGPGRPGAGADALDDRGDPRLRPVAGGRVHVLMRHNYQTKSIRIGTI